MKKLANIYIVIILLFLILIVFIVISNKNNHDLEIIYTDSLVDGKVVKFYCVDENNQVKCIDITINGNIYEEIFNLYNVNQNTLPVNYTSPLNGITYLKSISYENTILYIEIDYIPKDASIDSFLECLKKTYFTEGITKIVLTTNYSNIELK